MARLYQRMLRLSLLLLAPLYVGCERGRDISGIGDPAASAQTPAKLPQSATILILEAANSGGTIAADWVTSGKPTTLKLGKYELFVPKGAVHTPTTFRMTISSGVIGVSLEAFDNQGNPVTQFRTPLRLTLPYDQAHIYNFDDCKLLFANIVSETNHTILDIVQVTVNEREQTVTGNITHFSLWSLAKELSPGID